MNEKPILFSTPMVQANLEGCKTMTRRMTGLEKINENPDDWQFEWADFSLAKPWRFTYKPSVNKQSIADRSFYQEEIKCPYGQPGDLLWIRESFQNILRESGKRQNIFKADPIIWGGKWKPSIHMPKSAARIWAEIEKIRVERLQNISEEDAIAEGCYSRNWFEGLWGKLNGDASWEINPWVWVVKYKVLSTTGKPQLETSCPSAEADGKG